MKDTDFEARMYYEKIIAELEKMRAETAKNWDDAAKSRAETAKNWGDAAKSRAETAKIEKETRYYPAIMIMLAFTTSLVALVVALLK